MLVPWALDGEDAHEGRMLERSGQARFIDEFSGCSTSACGFSRFSATLRHSLASQASNTWPKPPSPSKRRTS